jgi:hypothetical protein
MGVGIYDGVLTSKYEDEYADAYVSVEEAGAAITFTKEIIIRGNYVGEVTVVGVAMRVRGDPRQYKALSLVEHEAPTLLFVPGTIGKMPDLGATCEWSGDTFQVEAVSPLSPDGVPILGRVVISGGLTQ